MASSLAGVVEGGGSAGVDSSDDIIAGYRHGTSCREWQRVQMPHSWRGNGGYKRGISLWWFRRMSGLGQDVLTARTATEKLVCLACGEGLVPR